MTSKITELLVAAIDLGTNYSGYAFSLKYDYDKDPNNVMVRSWNSGNVLCAKQASYVLCNPRGEFDSFGYDAEDKYRELSAINEHHNWYFFQRFKLMLYEKQVNTGLELKDEKGLKMPAKKVFAMAIRYLKDDLLHHLNKNGIDIRAHDIRWVLPVPTTWTVSAKDFLRGAANEAGIDGRHLTIVQESVAVGMYCELNCPSYCPNWKTLVDTNYIVTDLGDERICTTVLENKLDGAIKVVYTNSDRSIGSNKVDEAFIEMMIEIFGSQTFKKFCDEEKCDYIVMLREFGTMKSRIRTDSDLNHSLNLPFPLIRYHKSHTDQVKDAIERSRYRGNIVVIRGKMKFNANLFKSLFENTISNITKHLADVLERTDVKGTTALLMVGTFSECKLMQDALKKALSPIDVFTPPQGELAVVKGAVIFGHQSRAISQLDEDDVSSDDIANQSMCSSSYELGIRKDQVGNLKYARLSEEGEESLSSDYLEMSTQKQDKSAPALETQLENQMTLKVDVRRAPSDDELFVLSRKLDKRNKDWWLLAKLLGLSDKQIDGVEHGGGETVIQYYKMLIAWKSHNAGHEKGSVGYLLRQCDDSGIDRELTDTVFGN